MEGLGLSDWLVKACRDMSINAPTEVQRGCVPALLQGRDVVGAAPTGSGKTAAFALPILHTLALDPFGIFCLVISPTRELAVQISQQFVALGGPISVKISILIGGQDRVSQGLELKERPHIVIGTPGRVLDLLESYATEFRNLKFLVLDEADKLLTDEALRETIDRILQLLPSKKRQTCLFSATITNTFEDVKNLKLNNPHIFRQDKSMTTVEKLQQEYMLVPPKFKDCYLVYLLRLEEKDTDSEEEGAEGGKKKKKKKETINYKRPAVRGQRWKERKKEQKAAADGEDYSDVERSIIIFTSSSLSAQLFHEMFKRLGFLSVPLHGLLSQHQRTSSLEMFKAGIVKILVATDVASRGLDIPTVELVINFDLPKKVEDYIHRVGRTARVGRGGRAISLVSQFDLDRLYEVEKVIGKQLVEFEYDEEAAMRHMNETITARAISNQHLDQSGFLERSRELYEKREKYKQLSVGWRQDHREAASEDAKSKKPAKKKRKIDNSD